MKKCLSLLIILCLLCFLGLMKNIFLQKLWKDDNSLEFDDCAFQHRLEGPISESDSNLVSYVYSNILKPPSTLPYRLNFLPTVSDEVYLPNDNFFRPFLLKTFKNSNHSGFFIEAGALDGEVGSNTLWLEYKKNWTGLLIEPNQATCKVLESKHRRAWTSCSCISPKKYAEKSVFEIPILQDNFFPSLWLSRANVRSIHSRFHTYEDVIQNSASFTYSRVQCFPLVTYLLALNITVINLLSLDTQGGEKTVLLSFPFDKVKVHYMLIEYYKRGPFPKRKDTDLVSYLNSRGFDLLKMDENSGEYIFKNTNF